MHPLDSPRLKLRRANAEIDRLGLMQDAFLANTNPGVIRAENNSVSGKDVYRIKISGSPPPLDWGIYVGEIAHNLRSALNHLVYQLAFLNGVNKPETIAGDRTLQFPIFLEEKGERGFKRHMYMIKLLKSEHQTRIEGLQPYHSSCISSFKTIDFSKWSGRNSPLFWLDELNNTDKHRLIQVVGIRTAGVGTTYWGHRDNPFDRVAFGIIEDGTKFGEADPHVNVNVQISTLIAFANGCDAVVALPVCISLRLIATWVSEIVESFTSEFK